LLNSEYMEINSDHERNMGVIVAFAFNLAITEHCGGEQDTSLL
jgi:hypothetical protein